jgi:peptidyl-tRNA hydrolase, PTH2 family
MTDHNFLYKQVVVVRGDLKMSPAKLAVQVAHASVGAIYSGVENNHTLYLPRATLENWFKEGFRKVVLKVVNEGYIWDLARECEEHKIPYFVVHDFGLTELEENTLTCIGIGPDLNQNIDKITGRLGLYK